MFSTIGIECTALPVVTSGYKTINWKLTEFLPSLDVHFHVSRLSLFLKIVYKGLIIWNLWQLCTWWLHINVNILKIMTVLKKQFHMLYIRQLIKIFTSGMNWISTCGIQYNITCGQFCYTCIAWVEIKFIPKCLIFYNYCKVR